MLVFTLTILAVVALLVLDRLYPTVRESVKYTNLDWEILSKWDYSTSTKCYYGRIYSVIKNKIKIVYTTRTFYSNADAKEFTRKIYNTMREEFGLPSTSYINQELLSNLNNRRR